MSSSNLILHYDGVCVYATSKTKPNLVAIIILIVANLFFFTVITLFALEGIAVASLVFGVFELFIIKYTLWNFFGEERLIINDRSLSYQQHYGFFTTALHTISFNKKAWIVAYDEISQDDTLYVKFLFESYDENRLPKVMPAIHLN